MERDEGKSKVQLIDELSELRVKLANLEATAELLQKSEQTLQFTQFALEHLSESAYWMGSDARFIYVNKAACRSLGYSRGELLSMTMNDIDPGFPREAWPPTWKNLQDQGSFTFESHHRTKSGLVFPVEVRVNLVEFGGQQYNCAFARDITHRKKVEQAHRRAEALVSRAKNEWEQTFDAVPEPVCVLGEDQEVLRLNRSMAELLGLRPQDAVGKKCYECIHGTSSPPDFCPHVKTLGDGQLHEVEMWLEDRESWFLVSTTPLDDRDNGNMRVVHVMRDITERKKAEQDRLELERRIQESQKLESLGVLAGGIAHDFNNILTGILGYVSLASDDIPSTSHVRDYLREVEINAERAADLCRQMLAYAGEAQFREESIDLARLVKEMVPLIKTSTSRKSSFNLRIGKDVPLIRGDVSQLRQVIINTVINASEALGEEYGQISISVGTVGADRVYLRQMYLGDDLEEGEYVLLEVADTGCGMNEETRHRLLEPFFTTKFQGRGLGLSAVLGIVRRHKGALGIYSEPQKGTTFKIVLPSLDMDSEEVSKASVRIAHEGDWCFRGTILLVDDDETLRDVGTTILKRFDCQVITACDGKEAVAAYRSHGKDIDCIIMDLTMPRMSGEEAFHELRKIDSHVPIILTSGYTHDDVAKRFIGKNLSGFIQKPYRMEEMRETLRNVVESP